MGFILQNWLLILVAVIAGIGLFLPSARRSGGSGLSPAQAVRVINHEKGVVVDVRPQDQFEAGHIVNARSLPLESLASEGVSGLPTNKTLPLIVVCATGQSAKKALPALKKAGYESVQLLTGGLREWAKAEFPLETGPAKPNKAKK